MEFLALDLDLAQTELLWALGNEQLMEDVCLPFSP